MGQEKAREPYFDGDPSGFVHLRVRTKCSLGHRGIDVEDLVERVRELGMTQVAVADKWTLAAIPSFCKVAQQVGVKPIVGLEVDILYPGLNDGKSQRGALILLVKNADGYRNLCRLVASFARADSFINPAIELEEFEHMGLSDGLIGVSPCEDGIISRLLVRSGWQVGVEAARKLAGIFDEGDFYLGIGFAPFDDEENTKVMADENDTMVDLAAEVGCKVVVADVAQCLEKDDVYDFGLLFSEEYSGRIAFGDTYYFKSAAEARYEFESFPQAVAATLEIAAKCDFELEPMKPIIPRSPCIVEGETDE